MEILFLGGDKRYKYMMRDLAESFSVSQIGFDFDVPKIKNEKLLNLDLSKFDVILLPITGISDSMEIKTELGVISLPEDIFKTLRDDALVFTGLKTEKLLSMVHKSQIVSFLDFDDVKDVNDDLTVDGVIDDIRDRKNDTICILRLW